MRIISTKSKSEGPKQLTLVKAMTKKVNDISPVKNIKTTFMLKHSNLKNIIELTLTLGSEIQDTTRNK